MAGRKKKRSWRPKRKISLAVIAGMLPVVGREYDIARKFGFKVMANDTCTILTGFDPVSRTWNFSNLLYGAMPIALGAVAHKVAGMLGVNRMIAKFKLPVNI